MFKSFDIPALTYNGGVIPSSMELPPFEIFDLIGVGSFEPFIDLCRDPKGIADALGLIAAISGDTRQTSPGLQKVLYVIGVDDDPVSKIGISLNPVQRLADLQQSHYKELFLHSVYFFPKSVAGKAESAAIADAGDLRIRGEWIAEYPHQAAERVLSVAARKRYSVCDGASWLRSTLLRTRAVAKGRHAHRSTRNI
jgi:hypothetical protein